MRGKEEKAEKILHLVIFLVTVLAGLLDGIFHLHGIFLKNPDAVLWFGVSFLTVLATVLSYYRFCKNQFGKVYFVVTAVSVLGNVYVYFNAFVIVWAWVCGLAGVPWFPPQR